MPIPYWNEKQQRWQLNIQRKGTRKTFTSSKPRDREKAGMAECRRKAAIWIEGNADKSGMRFDRAFEAYIASQAEMVSEATINQRKSYGELYLVPKLGLKKMSSITDQDWQDIIAASWRTLSDRTGRKLSKKTLANIRAVIANFWQFAKRSQMIDHIPDSLILPKTAVKLPQRILQHDTLNTLFKPSDAFYIYLWRFMAVTGLRPGEAMGLQIDDEKDGMLTINRSITVDSTESKGKNENALRKIKLHMIAREILSEQSAMLFAKGIKSKWIFPNKWGDAPVTSGVRSAWDRYRAQNGIDCTMYGLRHSFVSLAKVDLPLALMKRVVGHSEDMDTLGTYGQDVDGELEQAAAILDSLFSRIINTR